MRYLEKRETFVLRTIKCFMSFDIINAHLTPNSHLTWINDGLQKLDIKFQSWSSKKLLSKQSAVILAL